MSGLGSLLLPPATKAEELVRALNTRLLELENTLQGRIDEVNLAPAPRLQHRVVNGSGNVLVTDSVVWAVPAGAAMTLTLPDPRLVVNSYGGPRFVVGDRDGMAKTFMITVKPFPGTLINGGPRLDLVVPYLGLLVFPFVKSGVYGYFAMGS